MSDHLQDDSFFASLARKEDELSKDCAPARLKSRIYSALVQRQETSGPLLRLDETKAQGHELCVFEELWQRAISADSAQCFNCCSLCHARVLAEHLENPPIYWPHCPYVDFGKAK